MNPPHVLAILAPALLTASIAVSQTPPAPANGQPSTTTATATATGTAEPPQPPKPPDKKRAQLKTYPVITESPAVATLSDYDDIIKIYTRPKIMTQIKLPDGEILKPVSGTRTGFLTGDKDEFWHTAGIGTPWFCVKPSPEATTTTAMVRSTAEHFYHFELVNLDNQDVLLQDSNGTPTRHRIQTPEVDALKVVRIEMDAAAWPIAPESLATPHEETPATALQAAQSTYRDRLDTFMENYALGVDAHYKVRNDNKEEYSVASVFNDGTFTWVRLTGRKALHVYEENDAGERQLLNYKIIDDIYRIDRICPVLVFADGDKGKEVIRIERSS